MRETIHVSTSKQLFFGNLLESFFSVLRTIINLLKTWINVRHIFLILYFPRSLRSSSIFKLQNFIKFACKQFQLDFNIFTIFYESSSKRDRKESYRVYRRRGYILQHFSVSHLAKIEREEKMRGF